MRLVSSLVPLVFAACIAPDETRPFLVDRPMLLAVTSDPAEAPPGAEVNLSALVVSPDGPLEGASLSWSLCRTPRALTENTPVSQVCASRDEQPLGAHGLSIAVTLPDDACARFGPETSLGLRPPDPDGSGGYYQPLRVHDRDLGVSVVRQRLRCAVAGAPLAVVQRFTQTYQDNRAPEILGLTMALRGDALDSDVLPADQELVLTLQLSDAAFEDYPVVRAGRLAMRRERLTVQWFVTGGELRDFEDTSEEAAVDNTWRTPLAEGTYFVWIVVHDDRGGVRTWQEQRRVGG